MAKPATNEQVLQGTLDLLILKTLSLTPMHGWGLTHRIEQLSQDALQVGQGSIYPALVRLEQRGAPGVGGAHPAADVLRRLHLQVKGELVVLLGGGVRAAAEQLPDAGERGTRVMRHGVTPRRRGRDRRR